MFNREHSLKEACQYFEDRQKTYSEAAEEKLRERDKEIEEYHAQLNKYRDQRELKDSELTKYTEAVYDNHMETALEAVYISALEKVTPQSEESINIAKNLVENYIKESGGARQIIRKNYGKTYLLDTIFEAVEGAAQKDIQLFYEAEKDDEKEKKKEKEEADGSDEVDKEDIKLGDADGDGVDDAQDSDFGTGADNDKNEEASDSKEKEDEDKDKKEDKPSSSEQNEEETEDESKDDEDSEDEEDDSKNEEEDEEVTIDDLDDEEVEDEEEEDEKSEDESEEESDPDLDEPDTKESIEGSSEAPDMEDEDEPADEEMATSKEELFDKLENDAEVSDAVDIIAKRISDAEAKFIEKNAEDKKKIENIVNKVQNRIDAVTDDESSTPEDIEAEEQEAKVEMAKMTTQIREDRFHTVFECMIRDNMDYIIKDKALNESYQTEDGKLDMTRVIDSSRAMYGWLETLNTIQLEKVNEEYIQKVLEGKI